MTDSQREDMMESARINMSIVDAVTLLVSTIKKIHSMFVLLAVGIPIVLCLFMVMLTWSIVQMGWNSEKRIAAQVASIPSEVAKALQITNTQTTTLDMGTPRTRDDNVRDVLKSQGKIKD